MTNPAAPQDDQIERPSAIAVRNEMARQLTREQLKIVGVWLGLESLEVQSNDVFMLGKVALHLADLKEAAQ